MKCHDGGNKIILGADAHHDGFILAWLRIKLPAHFVGVRHMALQVLEETKSDVPIENIFFLSIPLIKNSAEGNIYQCYGSRFDLVYVEVTVVEVELGILVGLWCGTGRAREV